MASFYRRPLPDALVAFASAEGRALFREALADGTMEGFFAQAEQFHTQQEPAFCGLATLVVALNALAIDPGRLWKGPWRWYGEELLDCCAPLDRVKQEGITFDQFACLARCNGATVEPRRASDGSVEELRAAIEVAASAPEGRVLAIAYTRRALGQTGDGHFSTIGGYHRGRDLALVLDVARFKYPPHWAPVSLLHEAMLPHDPATKRARGWITLRRGEHPPLAYRLSPQSASWRDIASAFAAIRAHGPLDDAMRAFLEQLPPSLSALVEPHDPETPEHERVVCAVVEALRATEIGAAVRRARGGDDDVATVLALIAPSGVFTSEIDALRDALPEPIASEIRRLREQLGVMTCAS